MALARDDIYTTLLEHVPNIRTAVKANLTQLSGALLAKHLISPGSDVKLRDRSQNEEDRAADLVTLVMDQVKLNPDNYKTFIDILKESGPHFENIIQLLPCPLDPLPRGGDQVKYRQMTIIDSSYDTGLVTSNC